MDGADDTVLIVSICEDDEDVVNIEPSEERFDLCLITLKQSFVGPLKPKFNEF